jgi:hypothetical protein
MSKRKTIVLTEHRSPRCKCPACGFILDTATNVNGSKSPSFGDITICLYCGEIAVYDVGLMLRSAEQSEIDDMKKHQSWGAIEKLIQAIREKRL